MYHVVSDDLPTVASFASISRAYAFRNALLRMGYQANVVQQNKI